MPQAFPSEQFLGSSSKPIKTIAQLQVGMLDMFWRLEKIIKILVFLYQQIPRSPENIPKHQWHRHRQTTLRTVFIILCSNCSTFNQK